MNYNFKKIWGEWKETIMVCIAFIVLIGVMMSLLWVKHDKKRDFPMDSTSVEEIKAKSFDYKGHQYILFDVAMPLGSSTVVHNPDCKKCKLTQ